MKALFSGNVQAVGFRAAAVVLATQLDLVGQVGNLSDGKVEVIAQGTEENLHSLVKQLEEMFSAKAAVSWSEIGSKYCSFKIAP